MFLTRIDDVAGDDYEAHRQVCRCFEAQKVLFQRKGHEIIVLSERPVAASEDVDPLLRRMAPGDKMLFRLRVNACITKCVNGKGRRLALPPGRIEDWLNALFPKHGFHADFVFRNEGRRRSKKGSLLISIASVVATGVLTVEDDEKCRRAICSGIGHAKGLGFGLLNVFDAL